MSERTVTGTLGDLAAWRPTDKRADPGAPALRGSARVRAQEAELSRYPWPPRRFYGRVPIIGKSWIRADTDAKNDVALEIPPLPDWREESGVFWSLDRVLYVGARACDGSFPQRRNLRRWFAEAEADGWHRLVMPRGEVDYSAVASSIGRRIDMYPTHSYRVSGYVTDAGIHRNTIRFSKPGTPDARQDGAQPWGSEWERALLCPHEASIGVMGSVSDAAPLAGPKRKQSVMVEDRDVGLHIHPVELWYARQRPMSVRSRMEQGFPRGYPYNHAMVSDVPFVRDSLIGIFGYWLEIVRSRVSARGNNVKITGPLCTVLMNAVLRRKDPEITVTPTITRAVLRRTDPPGQDVKEDEK